MSGSTTSSSGATAYVDATGIHVPTYADILASLQASFRAIYGQDVHLGNDSQDGQLLALFASRLADAYNMALAVYNQFSPTTAQGRGLSSNVKLNGITRAVPSQSTVDLLLTGVAGTTITNGVATDGGNNRWFLPGQVVIPPGGQITVTAIAETAGALTADPNTVIAIGSPTRGWQSVSNPQAATPGKPVETDAQLRARQAVSTALPSASILEGIVGAVAAVEGVLRYRAFENDTAITDVNGIPSHTIALVVEGGDAAAIANAIVAKKAPGVGTYGTTQQLVLDPFGRAQTISFYRPTEVPIAVGISLKAKLGYTASTGRAIAQAVTDWLNTHAIGDAVELSSVYVPVHLPDVRAGSYNITGITLGRQGGTPAAADVTLAFNEVAFGLLANVTVTAA